MLRILGGEQLSNVRSSVRPPPPSISAVGLEKRLKSLYDSGIESLRVHAPGGGGGTMGVGGAFAKFGEGEMRLYQCTDQSGALCAVFSMFFFFFEDLVIGI